MTNRNIGGNGKEFLIVVNETANQLMTASNGMTV